MRISDPYRGISCNKLLAENWRLFYCRLPRRTAFIPIIVETLLLIINENGFDIGELTIFGAANGRHLILSGAIREDEKQFNSYSGPILSLQVFSQASQ